MEAVPQGGKCFGGGFVSISITSVEKAAESPDVDRTFPEALDADQAVLFDDSLGQDVIVGDISDSLPPHLCHHQRQAGKVPWHMNAWDQARRPMFGRYVCRIAERFAERATLSEKVFPDPDPVSRPDLLPDRRAAEIRDGSATNILIDDLCSGRRCSISQ